MLLPGKDFTRATGRPRRLPDAVGDLAALWRAGLGLAFPQQCRLCLAQLEPNGDGGLCAPCWSGVRFLAAPLCQVCGIPIRPVDPNSAVETCLACLSHPPPYQRARAAFVYDDHSRRLVLDFKYGDRTEAAPLYGRWLARAGRDLTGGAQVIVPVPLHRWRLLGRRFNQAALLAQALGRETGIAVAADALVRTRATPQQKGLSARARRRNVAGAFAVAQGRARSLRGTSVLLIDDVLTTGATAETCTRRLLRAGVHSVNVLTLARVVPDHLH